VVDGISSQAPGLPPPGVQILSAVAPPGQPVAAGPSATITLGQPQAPGVAQQPVPGLASASSPSFVPDFSNGGGYVLDWRDPATKQVLVQVPMRTALASFAGADKSDASVGQQVNTKI
jgi:hypothetical protein